MPTTLWSNPYPLGLVTCTVAGTLYSLTANEPTFDADYPDSNAILLQAAETNTGRCYFGNALMNTATGVGVIFTFMMPGQSFVLSNFGLNVYRLSQFRVAAQTGGDKVRVSVYVR